MAKTTKAPEDESKTKKKPTKKSSETKAAKPAAKTKKTASKAPASDSKKAQEPASSKNIEDPQHKEQLETFSSEKIALTVKKHPRCFVEFFVQTKPPLIKQARDLALKDLAKEVTIPGFRKGKAPIALLVKKFAKSVDEQTVKKLADLAYREAQSLSHCPLLNGNSQINYDLKNRDFEKGIDMIFSFETEPHVPDIDPTTADFKTAKKDEIDDKKIDETIEQIRSFYSTHDVIKDRAAKEKDFVLLTIEDLETDPPSTVFKEARFEIKKAGMASWMKDIVIGMKPGETKEGVSKPNEDDSDEVKKEFKPKKVRVTLNEIQVAKLPELDENLAKKVGVNSIEEMRSQLKKLLEKQAEERYQDDLRECVIQTCFDTTSFDLPKSIVEREFTHRFNQSMQNEHFKREWATKTAGEQEDIQKDIMRDAEKAIRLFYISRSLVQKHNIQINRPEEPPMPSNVLEAMFTNREMMHFDTKSEDEQAYLMSKLLLRKAQDFVIEKAGQTKEKKSS